MAARTLVVTNDFPPRQGGIESFVSALVERMPPDQVVVYASRTDGASEYDAQVPYRVVRGPRYPMLPTPRVAHDAERMLREHGCTSVLFGAAAPLGLLAPRLRAAGAQRIVGLTHGHEIWWARMPGARQVLHRIGEGTDVLTYLGEYTRSRIAPALAPAAAARMARLPPGVDPQRFHPGSGGAALRARLGIPPERPVVLCVARLTPRKGQDTLIRAMPRVLARVPDALLVVAGGGPYRQRLEKLVREVGVEGSVLVPGSVPWAELPSWFDAADVFAMPCRTRRFGLEAEGLGIVFLEAAATGLPVVVGDSGGAPDACLPGETGYVVHGTDVEEVSDRVSELLLDRDLAHRMGERGRAWVQQQWQWDDLAASLRDLLEMAAP
ncbi:MAG: glycosyltransferase family 4 protein [Motilibacteraceae bacterium]